MKTPSITPTGMPGKVQPGMNISADRWNTVVDALPNTRAESSPAYNQRIWWEKLSFHMVFLTSHSVRIRAGNLRIHGDRNMAVAQTDVTLAGNPEWIYIDHERESITATIKHATSEPESTPTHLRIPLYKLEGADTTWALEKDLRFDINIDTPLGT